MEFTLREFTRDDIESVAYYANNPEIANKLRDVFPYPYTEKDAEQYIESCINADSSKTYCRAICVDGKAVGSIGVFAFNDVYRKTGEIGYWLGEPFWGKEIVSEAISQICAQAFVQLKLERIEAEPFAFNKGSRRVLEKAGFTLEGIKRRNVIKNGIIHDSCIYSLLK